MLSQTFCFFRIFMNVGIQHSDNETPLYHKISTKNMHVNFAK